jgi:hypothetical protein
VADVDPQALRDLADKLIVEHLMREAADNLRRLVDSAASGDAQAARKLSELRTAVLLDEREFLLTYDRLMHAAPEPEGQ